MNHIYHKYNNFLKYAVYYMMLIAAVQFDNRENFFCLFLSHISSCSGNNLHVDSHVCKYTYNISCQQFTLAVEKKKTKQATPVTHQSHVRDMLSEHNVTQSHSRNMQYIKIKQWFSRCKTLAQPASMALIAFGVVSSFNVFVVYLKAFSKPSTLPGSCSFSTRIQLLISILEDLAKAPTG